MSGWHPRQLDGGLAPNPQDPGNPSQAFPPTRPPLNTAALYFGNGCDVRLRPHVINSLISENLALVDSVGMNYNPGLLTNQRTAVEYVVQKGIPKYVVLNGQLGPGVTTANFYTGWGLNPPVLGGYNNGMVLCVIPDTKNQGFVRIMVAGIDTWVPVLRDDHQELESGDWTAWHPYLIGYFNGAFYQLGLSHSQVPILARGAVGFWIRTDGNDETGDGSANTPESAFRTIAGCWNVVGGRYASSPTFTIVMMLGIPGVYDGAAISGFGGNVQLIGDNTPGPPGRSIGWRPNRSQYRIRCNQYIGNFQWTCIWSIGVPLTCFGVTFVAQPSDPAAAGIGFVLARGTTGGNLVTIDCDFETQISSTQGVCIDAAVGGSVMVGHSSTCNFIGNGQSIHSIWYAWDRAGITFSHAIEPEHGYVNVQNFNLLNAGVSTQKLSNVDIGGCWVTHTGCTGPRWWVHLNSTFNRWGWGPPGPYSPTQTAVLQDIPGSLAGTVSAGGQVF